MADESRAPAEALVELARRRGLTLEPERAEAIRPTLESLLARLNELSTLVPPAVAPPPTPAPR
jgi:hypothetical protein